jgi:hypothetical protein
MKFFSKIKGTTFGNGQELLKYLKPGDYLFWHHESSNPYDSNAIMILTLDERKIGYLPRDTAVTIVQKKNEGKDIIIKISEITGKDKGNLGCNLEVTIND